MGELRLQPVLNKRRCSAMEQICLAIPACPQHAMFYVADEQEPLGGRIRMMRPFTVAGPWPCSPNKESPSRYLLRRVERPARSTGYRLTKKTGLRLCEKKSFAVPVQRWASILPCC